MYVHVYIVRPGSRAPRRGRPRAGASRAPRGKPKIIIIIASSGSSSSSSSSSSGISCNNQNT